MSDEIEWPLPQADPVAGPRLSNADRRRQAIETAKDFIRTALRARPLALDLWAQVERDHGAAGIEAMAELGRGGEFVVVIERTKRGDFLRRFVPGPEAIPGGLAADGDLRPLLPRAPWSPHVSRDATSDRGWR